MIKQIRFRFVLAAMLSLTAVLAIIVGIINIINFQSITAQSDRILSMLSAGEGRFSPTQTPPPPNDLQPHPSPEHSPELAFESRFFSVLLNDSGVAIDADLSHIAAIDQASAAAMAQDIYYSGRTHGFHGVYRYTVTGEIGNRRIIFLDCTRSLGNFYTFLWASLAMSLTGLVAVFILLFLLSGRIIRPLVESHEKQKQFITDAGHELKTPLTIINADAEVLEMELGSNEWLTDIHKQTARLTTLTNDLILLSRMEEGLPVQAINFPLSEVVSECAASFEAPARTGEKRLLCDIAPLLSLKGDEKALRQLISILLDNAVKYAPPHSDIHLSLGKKGKHLCLAVSNILTNPISKTELNHLFDRFYRCDRARTQGGHGIGLSLAQAIVAAHKGKIRALINGRTITFTVLLPSTTN